MEAEIWEDGEVTSSCITDPDSINQILVTLYENMSHRDRTMTKAGKALAEMTKGYYQSEGGGS